MRAVIITVSNNRMLFAEFAVDVFVENINVICRIKIFCDSCLIGDNDCEISFFLYVCNRFVRIGKKFKILCAVKVTRVVIYCSVPVEENGFSRSFGNKQFFLCFGFSVVFGYADVYEISVAFKCGNGAVSAFKNEFFK